MGGGASKPSPKVQPPPRAKPGAKSGQPLSVTESRTSAQPPPPPKQRVLLSKDDGGAVPTPKRPDAASIRVDGTHAQRPLPTTASQKREEKRRAAEEAKRLKEEQANTKKVAAEESKRAKKAAVDEAKRLKAEQAIAKKVATAAAGSPKVAPAPPTPSVNALNWEHTRKPIEVRRDRPPVGTVVHCTKTLKTGSGGAALGPPIVFGKHTVRFTVNRMTADGVVIGVADMSGAEGRASKPLGKAEGPKAWGVDLGRGCLLLTGNCLSVKSATLNTKEQHLQCAGHSAVVDLEIDMESQSLTFSINGQPKVRGAVRITDKVRPYALCWNKGDEIAISRSPAAMEITSQNSAAAGSHGGTSAAAGTGTGVSAASKPAAVASSRQGHNPPAAATRGKAVDPPAAPGGGSFKYDCFLTHDWGTDEAGRDNHQRVSRINKALQQAGLTTWFDEERLVGDIVQQMCDGIDQSTCVVVFITTNYITKVAGKGPKGATDNCKREFGYSWRRKGVEFMHACVMERQCADPSSWQGGVGMNLGGKLYTPLWEDEPSKMAEAVADIVESIRGMKRQVQPSRSLGQPHPMVKGQSRLDNNGSEAESGLQRSLTLIKKELGLRDNLPMTQAVQQASQMCGLATRGLDESLPEMVDRILGVLGIDD